MIANPNRFPCRPGFETVKVPPWSSSGPSFFEPAIPGIQPHTSELKMSQLEFEVSYRFGSGR